eukprot:evm.model.scf_118.3 EVM.evm.TU.scf_118.3   scf_118:85805-86796(+)
MIGFYILRPTKPQGGKSVPAVLSETPLVPMQEISKEYELLPDSRFVIMPCTFAPGQQGSFSLAVSSAHDFKLEALEMPEAGMLA